MWAKLAFLCVFGALAAGCSLKGNEGEVVQRPGQPNVIGVRPDDPEMQAAETKVRNRLDYFVEQWQNRRNPAIEFAVKFPLDVNGDIEHIWGSVESYNENTGFACLLANEPLGKSDLRAGDPITVSKDRVEDWLIRRSDTDFEGGYTVDVLRSREASRD